MELLCDLSQDEHSDSMRQLERLQTEVSSMAFANSASNASLEDLVMQHDAVPVHSSEERELAEARRQVGQID